MYVYVCVCVCVCVCMCVYVCVYVLVIHTLGWCGNSFAKSFTYCAVVVGGACCAHDRSLHIHNSSV